MHNTGHNHHPAQEPDKNSVQPLRPTAEDLDALVAFNQHRDQQEQHPVPRVTLSDVFSTGDSPGERLSALVWANMSPKREEPTVQPQTAAAQQDQTPIIQWPTAQDLEAALIDQQPTMPISLPQPPAPDAQKPHNPWTPPQG